MWSNELIRIKNTMYYNTSLECWLPLDDFIVDSPKLYDIPLKTSTIIILCWEHLKNKNYNEKEIIDDLDNIIKYNNDYVWVFDSINHPTKSICCRIDDCILVGMHETLDAFGFDSDFEKWKNVECITEIEINDIAYIDDLLS